MQSDRWFSGVDRAARRRAGLSFAASRNERNALQASSAAQGSRYVNSLTAVRTLPRARYARRIRKNHPDTVAARSSGAPAIAPCGCGECRTAGEPITKAKDRDGIRLIAIALWFLKPRDLFARPLRTFPEHAFARTCPRIGLAGQNGLIQEGGAIGAGGATGLTGECAEAEGAWVFPLLALPADAAGGADDFPAGEDRGAGGDPAGFAAGPVRRPLPDPPLWTGAEFPPPPADGAGLLRLNCNPPGGLRSTKVALAIVVPLELPPPLKMRTRSMPRFASSTASALSFCRAGGSDLSLALSFICARQRARFLVKFLPTAEAERMLSGLL